MYAILGACITVLFWQLKLLDAVQEQPHIEYITTVHLEGDLGMSNCKQSLIQGTTSTRSSRHSWHLLYEQKSYEFSRTSKLRARSDWGSETPH